MSEWLALDWSTFGVKIDRLNRYSLPRCVTRSLRVENDHPLEGFTIDEFVASLGSDGTTVMEMLGLEIEKLMLIQRLHNRRVSWLVAFAGLRHIGRMGNTHIPYYRVFCSSLEMKQTT